MPIIPKLPRGSRQYLAAFDLRAIAIARKGEIIVTKDPTGCRAAFWCLSKDAERVAAEARRTRNAEDEEDGIPLERHIVDAGYRLGVGLTGHLALAERVARSAARLEALTRAAANDGLLKFFHNEYRRRREVARAAGKKFLPFAVAQRRLKQALARAAVMGGVPPATSLIAEVFKTGTARCLPLGTQGTDHIARNERRWSG